MLKMFNRNKQKDEYDKALTKKSFILRLFISYIPIWILVFIVIIIIADSGSGNNFLFCKTISNLFGLSISLIYLGLIATIIPVWTEINIQRKRRKQGFSAWGNVTKDFDRLEIEEKLKLEQEAKENLGIGDEGSVDKMDIRYWHGLLKEGIIDQEEFELKKRKLL